VNRGRSGPPKRRTASSEEPIGRIIGMPRFENRRPGTIRTPPAENSKITTACAHSMAALATGHWVAPSPCSTVGKHLRSDGQRRASGPGPPSCPFRRINQNVPIDDSSESANQDRSCFPFDLACASIEPRARRRRRTLGNHGEDDAQRQPDICPLAPCPDRIGERLWRKPRPERCPCAIAICRLQPLLRKSRKARRP